MKVLRVEEELLVQKLIESFKVACLLHLTYSPMNSPLITIIGTVLQLYLVDISSLSSKSEVKSISVYSKSLPDKRFFAATQNGQEVVE